MTLVQKVEGDFEITEAYITKDNVVSKVIFYDEEGVQYIAYFVHEDFIFNGRNFYEGSVSINNQSDQIFEFILSGQKVKELSIWKIYSDAVWLDIIL